MERRNCLMPTTTTLPTTLRDIAVTELIDFLGDDAQGLGPMIWARDVFDAS